MISDFTKAVTDAWAQMNGFQRCGLALGFGTYLAAIAWIDWRKRSWWRNLVFPPVLVSLGVVVAFWPRIWRDIDLILITIGVIFMSWTFVWFRLDMTRRIDAAARNREREEHSSIDHLTGKDRP